MSIFRHKQFEPSVTPDHHLPSSISTEGLHPSAPREETSIKLAGANATPLAIAEAEVALKNNSLKEDEAQEETPEHKPRLLESFDLKGRIQEAYSSCEIKLSSEVMEALAGYFTDHYELADMIGVACGDSISRQDLQTIIVRENGVVDKNKFDEFIKSYQYAAFPPTPSAESGVRLLAYLKLKEIESESAEQREAARDTLLRCASACLEGTLFNETSLGITTLEDDDIEYVRLLHGKVLEASKGTSARPTHSYGEENSIEWPVNYGSKDYHRFISPKYIIGDILRKKEEFWEDCRMAGQLEIHNTGHLPLIAQRGNTLLPRTEQFRRYGTMHVQTAVFDNMHSVVPHFSERLDPGTGYKIGGTDPKYRTEDESRGSGSILIPLANIIKVAPFARDAYYAVVEQKDSTKLLVSPPSPQYIESIDVGMPDNEGKYGKDRVFFSSNHLAEQPDSFGIKLGSTSTILFIGQDNNTSKGYGSGYGFPKISRAQTPGEASDKVYQAQQRVLELPVYKDKIVVPLRRHVFDFTPENKAKNFNSSGRKAPSYNLNPLLQKT